MQNRILDIISLKINNEFLTEEEENLLNEWLCQNDDNHLIFNKLEERYSDYCALKSIDTNKAYTIVKTKLVTKTRKRIYKYLGIAASILVLFTSTILIFKTEVLIDNDTDKYSHLQIDNFKSSIILATGKEITLDADFKYIVADNNQIIFENKDDFFIYTTINDSLYDFDYHTLEVPKGAEYKMILPDSTKVWINSDSKFHFPNKFKSNERKVILQGEAFFEVKPNSESPFIVSSNGCDIEVLGTSFNISSYKDSEKTSTTLIDGSVKIVLHDDSSRTYLLKPNEMAVLDKETQDFFIKEVDVKLFTSWREGYYKFEAETIENIMSTLSKWYDFEIEFGDENIKTKRFSGKLVRYENIIDLLKTIELMHDLEFIISEKTIKVINRNS